MFFVHRSNCDLVNMLPVAFWMIGLTSSMCAGVTLDFCLSTCRSGSHIIHHIGVDLDIGTSRGEHVIHWNIGRCHMEIKITVCDITWMSLVPLGQMKRWEKNAFITLRIVWAAGRYSEGHPACNYQNCYPDFVVFSPTFYPRLPKIRFLPATKMMWWKVLSGYGFN